MPMLQNSMSSRAGDSVLYCNVLKHGTVQYTEGAECPRTDAIKISNLSLLDYKLPLAPKREFLAIPNGWRRNRKSFPSRNYPIGSDGVGNDDY